MTEARLLENGKVGDTIAALSAQLRDNPTDVQRRTFLFELLCFSGQYDRAEKQLAVLARDNKETELGAVLYYSALHAEKTRHDLFRSETYPRDLCRSELTGTLNGKPFTSISDADQTIGARLEVFVAGSYVWVPFEHIASIQLQEPKRLRDTLWTPALVQTGPSFEGADMGEVLIPVVYPFSWKSDQEMLWLGRGTSWVADDQGAEFPVGQKIFLVDGAEMPLLQVRSITIDPAAASFNAAS
ncbi:MAG: virulence protein SciE type [Bryobacteraceae bacterium]|nr:virulence protein SciE type [Bryobacteraceae bacterium]